MGAEQSAELDVDVNEPTVNSNPQFKTLKEKFISRASEIDELAKNLSENNDSLTSTIDSYLAKVENNQKVIDELKVQLEQREEALMQKSDQ